MAEAIENLRNAIKTASGTSFALDATFLTDGLNEPSVSVPADFNSWIQDSFQVENATDFKIEVARENVGPVENDAFTVTQAKIPFLGATSPIQTPATLVFAINTNGSDKTLVVQIQSLPENWTWTDSFAFMMGFPFNQLDVLNAQFIFSTDSDTYPWTDDQGRQVVGGANQNVFADLPLPNIVKPFLVLFDGLTPPSGNLLLRGVFDMSVYNGDTVLFPPATLQASISESSFKLLYLTVSDPSVTVTIPPPDNTSGGDSTLMGLDDDNEDLDQTPLLSVSSGIGIDVDSAEKSPYTLQVQILPPMGSGQNGEAGETTFSIGLVATGEGSPLTAESIITLVGGGGSYFTATPPILQQFLAMVSLQGLTLGGTLGQEPRLTSMAVQIGSAKDTEWTPIPNAPSPLDFTVKSFTLMWSIQNPSGLATRQQASQTFLFNTQFTMATNVFKGPNGQGDGVFTVEFNSNLQFYAAFEGTASLSDFLATLTAGAVSLPDSIQASLSNIRLNIDYNAKSVNFSGGYDISLAFLEVGGKPIISISDGEVRVAAKTATQEIQNGNAKTVWQSEISGLMAVGPLAANVKVGYDGFQTPARWNLNASLAREIDVQQLIQQFFNPDQTYQFPDFLPGNLNIKTFNIDATIPSGQGDLSTSYSIDTTFSWLFQFGDQQVGIDPAKIGLQYDGSKAPGAQFSGLVEGTWVYTAINLKLLMGYQFEQTQAGSNQTLFIEWEGFRAEYQSRRDQKQIIFSLQGWSLGTLIQALVRTLGNPYFVLPSPWDLLNQISLDGLRVNVSLESGLSFSQRLSASYELSSPINLGFIEIKGLTFFRTTEGKVNLAIDGEISSVLLNAVSPEDRTKLENLTNTSKGQDTQDLPSVPGRGQETFKLFLLVLGQRVSITGHTQFNSTQEVIAALANVPATTGNTNPVNPNANQGSPPNGLPYYDPGSNWLIAGHLGFLKAGNAWTVDAMLVFNDPNLYGLRLALAGPKVGGLANLSIDILYKKITDDIGVFQIEFTFPDAIRNLNFGSVSITLPEIGVKIYTNGDFFIDIGFPYNLDFRRSFSIAAIVYGVPVLGSGGFYFGKLSNATSTQVPQTDNGTFDPVIVFGVGLQLGLGYNFTIGPLSAGFALTVFGIVEGVIAAWHPYDQSDRVLALRALRPKPTDGLALTGAADSVLQSDYYFKVSGTVGIIGLIYGKIDFVIIQATVSVKITLSLQLTYESYRAIPIVARATVDIVVKVKIDLFLFTITISLSFSAEVSAKFVIGSNETAPWHDSKSAIESFLVRNAGLLSAGPTAARLRARQLQPRQKRVVALPGVAKPTLTMLASPIFTVLAPEGATEYAQQEGAFASLFAMDAPDATSSEPRSGNTSFDQLCATFFPWVIDALGNSVGDEVDLQHTAATNVTRQELESYIEKLADIDAPPLDIAGLLSFMQTSFTLNIETPDKAQGTKTQQAMEAGATVFPVFDGLSLTVPNPAGSGDPKPITFETYTTATSAYSRAVAEIFAEVQAVIEQENESNARLLALQDDDKSMASVIFVDTFLMIGRQLLQAALDQLNSYAYPLQPDGSDSIQSIIDALNAVGNNLTPHDISLPNKDHALSPGIKLAVDRLVYTIQAEDTLSKIATRYSDQATSAPRWTTTPAALITYKNEDGTIDNGRARILQPNVTLTLQGQEGPVSYTTIPGDNFNNMAESIGITLDELARQEVLYDAEGLLTPAAALDVPMIEYTTAPAASSDQPSPDTLNSVATLFATTVSRLADDNTTVSGLFSPAAEKGVITLANLAALQVSDLWSAIQSTDQVAQTAGMVSRFLMFGLRLPVEAGLTLSDQFLYPRQQTQYALYQLTGQQFPTPATSEQYEITISRADTSHGVDLSFIQFNGAAGTSVSMDLTDIFKQLTPVLTYAQEGKFLPAPIFQVEPLSTREPKAFAINTFAYWSTSDMVGLKQLTDRSGTAAVEDTGAQAQPILWPLPPSLLNMIGARQARLTGQFQSLTDVLPLLPQFKPQVGSTSPATGQTAYEDIQAWAWTTRVDFQIKKLPANAVAAQAGTGEGSIPYGPSSAPSLPNVYELVGPSSEDSLRLEQLLVALDALGEDLISSVFLLYEQAGSSSPKLVTLGSQEFLAFITQTNLSTETNPVRSSLLALARDDQQPPRGIANSPGEFVKLLWELSVVRSGGYYLFYQVADGGAGLPASIFDASGTATLSMVVTYAVKGSQPLLGETLFNCVNSFLTTDSIDTSQDIVQLVSESAVSSSAPLGGEETLAWLSAIYGPGPGRIAEVNATQPLTAAKVIPISGIVRQLRPADVVTPEQTLEQLATYYSVGAETPITAAEIRAFNPGVSVEVGAVFYIPPVNYVVAAAAQPGAAPGDTFASIATYYGLSIDAVAVLALNVVGLFPQDMRLNINSQLFDLRSTLGPGNVGVRLERVNLGEPTPGEADFPEKYLYQMYNTLSAGFQENVYFRSSPLGLPFGPQTYNSDAEPTTNGSQAQLQAQRVARLQAGAEKDFDYRQSLGFVKFANINAAPHPQGTGLPPQADNPYIGIGSTAQVALRWQDILGNTTITPFDKLPADYQGTLNGEAATILYNDRLVGVGNWPNVQASYIYAADNGSPNLQLTLKLDTTNYNEVTDQVKKEFALFKRIYFQLHQDYTGLGVPGVGGHAVSMSLTNSLLQEPHTALQDDKAQVVRDFVAECVQYLDAFVNGTQKPPQPQKTLSIPVSLDDLKPGNIIELDVELILTRQAILTDPTVAALNDGLSVTSPILPKANSGETAAYIEFATAFENVFQSDQWYMKVGEGLGLADQSENPRNQQLWATRFGKAKGVGIYFDIGESPSYYAPKPVANSLQSKRVEIVNYRTGETELSNFTGVDLNLWFQTCLDAIDVFLAADYSSPAFILDKILGTNDPLKDGYLGKVLKAKQLLADTIASTVRPALSNSASDPSSLWAAQEKLRQQLLNELGAAYKAGTVTVFGLSDVSGAPASTPAGPPNLYGQPAGQAGSGAANQNFTLSPAKIPLGNITSPDGEGEQMFNPQLAFLLTSKNLTSRSSSAKSQPDQAYVPLDLRYQITHLEFDRTTVAGITGGYVQSRWMQFVRGPFDYQLGKTVSNIPIVNRALPMPPTVQKQAAAKYADPTTPADLAKWDYSFEYIYQYAPGDAVQATIELNYRADEAALLADGNGPDLFGALAQFVSSYPAILADFKQYLRQIDAKAPDQTTVDNAKQAVSAFEQYVTNVANEYRRTVELVAAETLIEIPELVRITFEIALDATPDNAARTDILTLQIDGQDATWDPTTHTISNGTVTLPALVVEIDPQNYNAVPVNPPPGTTLAYIYEKRPETSDGSSSSGPNDNPLPYRDAQANPLRTVKLPTIDVLAYQNAWSEIYVQRNRILFPIEDVGKVSTTPDFLFQTPIVKFSDPIVPRLSYARFPLAPAAAGNGEDKLEAALNTFFQGLFSGGNGKTAVEISMSGGYSYLIQPDLAQIPRTRLPINMLPPTETPVNPVAPLAFTGPVASTINTWRESQQPTEEGQPQINFDLQVFGASSAKQPLLVVADLYYQVTMED